MATLGLNPVVGANYQKYWWLFLVRGLLALAIGVFALMFPVAALSTLVLFIGAYFVVDGVVAIAKAIQILRTDKHWWIVLLEGIAGVIVGLLMFVLPGVSLVTLALLVGVWAVVSGVLAIVSALRLRTHVPGEWLYLVFAVVSIVFGIYVLMQPATGLVYIALMISIYGFIAGVSMIALAFRARSGAPTPVA